MNKVRTVLYSILQNYKNWITLFIQWSKEKKKEVDTEVFEWEEDGVGVRVTFCAEDIKSNRFISKFSPALTLSVLPRMPKCSFNLMHMLYIVKLVSCLLFRFWCVSPYTVCFIHVSRSQNNWNNLPRYLKNGSNSVSFTENSLIGLGFFPFVFSRPWTQSTLI